MKEGNDQASFLGNNGEYESRVEDEDLGRAVKSGRGSVVTRGKGGSQEDTVGSNGCYGVLLYVRIEKFLHRPWLSRCHLMLHILYGSRCCFLTCIGYLFRYACACMYLVRCIVFSLVIDRYEHSLPSPPSPNFGPGSYLDKSVEIGLTSLVCLFANAILVAKIERGERASWHIPLSPLRHLIQHHHFRGFVRVYHV